VITMRILLITHTMWNPDLGAPQAQMALADHCRKLGDQVAKYSYEDAFAQPIGSTWLETRIRSNRSFAARAHRFVREHGSSFDIIEANQTDLPFSKRQLRFSGLLIARSVGLIPAYERFERFARAKWPSRLSSRSVLERAIALPRDRRRRRHVQPSLAAADLINVSNQDDLVEVRDGMGFGPKVVFFPLGIDEARADQLATGSAHIEARRGSQRVAFIGTWNERKGARDWPLIVHLTREQLPRTTFLFLGTSLTAQEVRRQFADADRHAIEVVPSFRSRDLPQLLHDSTVGAFPGYLEGFGIGILELLAAGLPVVAYDAPGVRETLQHQTTTARVPLGDVESFSNTLVGVLTSPLKDYSSRAAEAASIPSRFYWSDIAKSTRDLYSATLDKDRK
jgi:glycosyltransferase involved in cell wall biosynthesis